MLYFAQSDSGSGSYPAWIIALFALEVSIEVIYPYLLELTFLDWFNIAFVVDFEKAATAPVPQFLRERIICGYNFHRSGDIIVCVEPGYYEYAGWSSPVGTTHGEWNPYDAHIPLLFYGWKVPHGASPKEVHITDIAPTVCLLLHIQQPNACIGESLQF